MAVSTKTLCQKYFESRGLRKCFEEPVLEKFFQKFIKKVHFSWAQLSDIAIGGNEGFYTEEYLFEQIDRAGFPDVWSAYADKLNTRRSRGNCLQEWCLPRRLFLFWSE